MPDDDELERRSKQLAKEILETLDTPGENPERAAYEEEKERRDRESLEAYYEKTGQTKDRRPKARSTTEMVFAASLKPCPSCQTAEAPQYMLVGSGTSWSVTGECPRCRTRRAYAWPTEGHPNQAEVRLRQLGDARPSAIIRVGELIAELDRLLLLVHENPAQLQPIAWRASVAAAERALTCLHEVLKFVPQGMKIIPDTKLTDEERTDRAARRERYERAWLEGELDRIVAIRNAYTADAPRIWALEAPNEPPPAIGAIDRASLRAHEKWIRAKREGPGRLEVVGYNARGLRLAGVLFQGGRLERVNFDNALLEAAYMQECELRDISANGANCTSIHLNHATISGGTFHGALLALAKMEKATIDQTSFDDASFERSTWAGARVTAASFDRVLFANAWLDGGCFVGCTFRNADLRLVTERIRCTTAGAVFEDCDFRFTRWDGRNLSGASLIRCKLHGITGKPAELENVRIVDPDLSVDGDGSDIRDAEDLLARWR